MTEAEPERFATQRRRFWESPFLKELGIVLGELRPGHVEVQVEASPEMANRNGTVHGGVIATLADAALSQSVRTLVDMDVRTVTVEFKISYLSPGNAGRLVGVGDVEQIGGSLATASARVIDSERNLVAIALGTVRISRSERSTPLATSDMT